MNKINCNIVRDLFPSYLDKLTSKESNELLETHLTDCAECKEILSALSQTVTVDTKDANREIDYLKKIKAKRKKVLLFTVLACTLVFSTITAIGIKLFVIGSPIAFHAIDFDKTDEYVGITTKFNPETNELTLYGEILLNRTVFSGIKVEKAKGLVNAYNVTVYGAERFSNTQEQNRKFEQTIKIPDDNKDWSIYSVGAIPQDTVMFWSNSEYLNEKSAPHLQKLTDYLTEQEGFSSKKSHLERNSFREILGDPCYTFDFHNNEDCMSNVLTIDYAVSEDCERMYYYDAEKGEWIQF